MGPSLWGTDPNTLDGGHGGHYDMLHNSPNAMGIAWEDDNVYWVFDGYHSSITRYDFGQDHGAGGTLHDDGVTARYVEGEVDRKADVPSHMEYDPSSELLYIADTGNKRIAVLDTTTGTDGSPISPNYDSAAGSGSQYEVNGADISTLVDGEDHEMTRPSGLALRDGVVYVSDNKRAKIMAYDIETGDLIDYLQLDLDEGALMGITFDEDGNLWFTDSLDDRIVRISVPEE
jgi:sugar lactone lactonase YvrE